jgi:KUP system potassium uptake protein
MLMAFTLLLTIGFGSSDRLAAAFGIAVAFTMLLTTVLLYGMMREQWRWSRALALAVAGSLALVDGSFVAANLTKVVDGGWVPLVAATILFVLMSAWRSGRQAMVQQIERETLPLPMFIESTADSIKVEGTAVYLSRRVDVVPVALLHSVKHYQVLHRRNVILGVETEQVPRVPDSRRIAVTELGHDFYRIVLHYGFMQQPDIPLALANCKLGGQGFEMMQTSFFLSRVTIAVAGQGWDRFTPALRRLYSAMHHNEVDATEFFAIPRNRIVEMGARIEL